MSTLPEHDKHVEKPPFQGAVLAIPKELELLCNSFNFYNLWLLLHHSKSQKDTTTVKEEGKRSKLFALDYNPIFRILEFLASAIHFKTQNCWGSAGSSWGGAPDLVFVERPFINPTSRGGLSIRLQVKSGTIINNAKFSVSAPTTSLPRWASSSARPGWTHLEWKGEEGSTRGTKPVSGSIKFLRNANDLIIYGWVQFRGEGKIDEYGRLRTFDKKTGKETTGGPIKELDSDDDE